MRRVIVLSGKDRCLMVQAMVGETWLRPSGVVGMAVDNVDYGFLERTFGAEIADRVLVRYREFGGTGLGRAVVGGRKVVRRLSAARKG